VYTVEPKLLGYVQNGTKYVIKNDTTYVYVVKVKGTPYDMGYAYGSLFASELQEQVSNFYAYLLQGFVDKYVNDYHIPLFIAKYIGWGDDYVFKGLLDLNWRLAEPYTPPRFIDEMRGIAAASGVEYKQLVQINMLPELTRAHCTIVGAWGKATSDDSLVQLRALDWDNVMPINKFPLITIYQPSQGGHAFANIGYLGLIGSITAFSSAQIAISEKVWIPKP